MDGFAFIASLVQSVAWPAAATAIAFSQKAAITNFIGKIRSAKAFGAEIGIAEQIEAVREKVEAAPPGLALPAPPAKEVELTDDVPAVPSQKTPAPRSNMIAELSDELAASSAVGSIVASWLQLSNGLQELSVMHGVAESRASPLQTIKTLRSLGILNDETYDAINQLRTIRNRVVHSGDPSVSLADAQAFRESVRDILSKIGLNASLLAWR